MEEWMELPWLEWKIIGILGKGSFGSVYKVQKTEYGHISQAAVKIIRIVPDEQKQRELENSGISVESYLKEIKSSIIKEIDIMESLKGAAHIVSIEDSRIQKVPGGWVIYIRMELLKSLSEIQKERVLTLRDVIKLGEDLCQALEVCERRDIIHRDIKPANIFWSELGGYKLGDFGIARYMESTMAGSTKAGTESYMAPEIYRGEKYGKTVDIYSLGLVLYQLANNGRFPFLSSSGADIGYSAVVEADRRRREGEPFPNPCNGGRPLGNILRKACAYRVEDRYQKASDLESDLHRLRYIEENPEEENSATILLSPEGEEPTVLLNHKEKQLHEDSKSQKKGAVPWILGITAVLITSIMLLAVIFLGRGQAVDFLRKEEPVSVAEKIEEQEENAAKEKEDNSQGENTETVRTEVQMPYSGRIWENGNKIYTVYDVDAEGFRSISGSYVDTMAVYGDKIYWRMNNGVENVPCPIISMNLNGEKREFLTDHAYASTFLCIHDGWLYYTSADGQGNKGSRKIDLETGKEEEAPPYIFRNGNEKVWFSTGIEDGKWYISDPGFQNPNRIQDLKGTRLAVRGYKLYYMLQNENGTYTTCSYDSRTEETETLLTDQYAKSVVSGEGLYFKQETGDHTILYRRDLETGEQTEYDIGNFHLYLGGGFYELKDQICFMRFCPENGQENTEFWSMDRVTGERQLIGKWYNSNAVNAALEP